MSEISEKVSNAIKFLTEEEIIGVLQGTLEGIEENNPGYTDLVILGVLSHRAGIRFGKLYGDVNED